MKGQYEKTIDDLLKDADNKAKTHKGLHALRKSSNREGVEKIKEYGTIEASKNEVIKVELVSWNGKKPVLSIMRYRKSGQPIKGMLFSKDKASELSKLLSRAIKDKF